MLISMWIAPVLLYLLFWQRETKRIRALSLALVTWLLYLYVITELLSVGHHLTAGAVSCVWIVTDLLLIFALIRGKRSGVKHDLFPRLSGRGQRLLLVLWGLFALGMVALSVLIVPSNQDSMTYHLTRILCWAQNQSIGHFATTVTRCVGSPVLGECVGLHVYLLSGGSDVFLNLTQCLSYLLCGVLVFGITRKIGGTWKTASLSACVFYAVPIAFAEATSTQVDEFATLFLLVFVDTVLDLMQEPRADFLAMDSRGRKTIYLLAVSAALGYLAKPSVMVGMFGFALWLFVCCIRRKQKAGRILLWVFCTAALALVVIAPELVRNLVTYHAISDPWQGKGQLVHSASPADLLISFLKNLFFNLPAKWWPGLSSVLVWFVYSLGGLLHVDVDSETISEFGRPYALNEPGNFSVDGAVSPVITAAMLLCIAIYVVHLVVWLIRGKKGERVFTGIGYSTVAVFLFLLMCVLIRWELWIGRYQLPYFALLCPAVAIQLQKVSVRYRERHLAQVLAGVLALFSFAELGLYGFQRTRDAKYMHDVSREQAYFWDQRGLYTDQYLPLTSELDTLELPSEVGLISEEGSYCYPVMRYLINKGCSCTFVTGSGDNAKYEDSSFAPDLIVMLDTAPEEETIKIHGAVYHVLAQPSDSCWILERE